MKLAFPMDMMFMFKIKSYKAFIIKVPFIGEGHVL